MEHTEAEHGATPLPVSVAVHVTPSDLRQALEAEVRTGLQLEPKELSPKWLYDSRGSQLFDQITRLPEYYPTRREREILARRAREIARLSGADTLVELGSGTSEKTRLLLDALREADTLRRFVPFDVSEAFLCQAARRIAREYAGLQVQAVVGDFERHLLTLPRGGRRLVAFLGGTLGNLKPHARAAFLGQLGAVLNPGDAFLLGTDLVKDRGRLRAAYNDSQGITAAFNKNVLRVLNRELQGDFEPAHFDHVARFDEDQRWIEMLLVSQRAQSVRFQALGLEVSFQSGEPLRTEVSCKFRAQDVEAELAAADLSLAEWWTDDAADFAVSLSVKRP